MTVTSLGLGGFPVSAQAAFANKTPASYPAVGTLIEEFDLWQPNYAGATVHIYRAGTTELAPVFTDPEMTTVATNPHVLRCFTDGAGVEYGKFQSSLYTPFAYELDIDTTEQTGVQRIYISSLDGEDASNADVKSTGSTRLRTLKERFADVIYAEDYGEINTSPTTNTATITAAISVAAQNGGGVVRLPEGIIPINTLTLSTGVVLRGQGMGVTTITSNSSANVVTSSGNKSGMMDLTLDGINLNAGSVGWYSKDKTDVLMENVTIKRFETCVKHIGGTNHSYNNFHITDAGYGFRGLGDSDATGGADGAAFTGMHWFRGSISVTTTAGLDLAVVDLACSHNTLEQVDFDSNIGAEGAIYMYGAQWLALRQCSWTANTVNFKAADNPDSTLTDRQCIGLNVDGGKFNTGELEFDGLCQDFIFKQVQFVSTTFELNIPQNQILFLDVVESSTSITGQGVKLSRARSINGGNIKGNTEDATATNVYKTALNPNEVVLVEVKVTAEQTNGTDYAAYHITHAFRCAPATLNYDAQTANYTVGDTITGATSGATAVIVADSDGGSTGTLSLGSVSGTFANDEIITGATTGSARINGVLTLGDVTSVGTATEHHSVGSNSGNPPAGWGGVAFAVDEQEAQITVQGASSTNINWNVSVDLTVL